MDESWQERVVVVLLGKEFNLCVNNERTYVKGYDILISHVVTLQTVLIYTSQMGCSKITVNIPKIIIY